MRRFFPLFLAAILACAGAFAQESDRTPQGGFLPPKINWVKPAPTQPAPTQPAPTQPAPTQPAPTQPVPARPTLTTPARPDDNAVPQNLEPFHIPYIPEVAHVAMALPVDAPGLIGRAAHAFHQGCVRGVQKENARLWIDLYPASDPETERAAYESALANDAQFIIGPMSKSGVRAVLEKHPNAPVPTILLQPPPAQNAGGENHFIMTLDSAREAAALAQLLQSAENARAVVVALQSPIGKRQAAAFASAWRQASDEYPRMFSIGVDPESANEDFRRMFEAFKKQTESESALDDPPPPPAVFLAGDSEFARRARSYLPARYPAYSASVARAADNGPAALQLEGMRFLEVPWLADPLRADFGDAAARSLVERRFFALGVDACRAALHAADWSAVGNGWTFYGASGTFTLRDNEFRRVGMLAEYRDGRAAAVIDEADNDADDEVDDDAR